MIINTLNNTPLPKPGTLFVLNSKAFPLYLYKYRLTCPPSKIDFLSREDHRLAFVSNPDYRDYYMVDPPLLYLTTLLTSLRSTPSTTKPSYYTTEKTDTQQVLIHLFLLDQAIWYLSEGDSLYGTEEAIFSHFLLPLTGP